MVRCMSIDPIGQYLASGSDDMSIKGSCIGCLNIIGYCFGNLQFSCLMFIIVWEISTARCMRTINVGGIVRSIDWCPNKALSLIAVAADRKLLLVNPGLGDTLVVKKTDSLLKDATEEPFVGWSIIT